MRKDSALLYPLVETWWPSDFWDGVRLCIYNLACAGLSIKRSAFITWLGQCVLFLCKTLFSHSAHSTQECKLMSEVSQESLMKCQGGWGGGEEGVTMGWTGIWSRGSVVILLVTSCEETRIISPWTGWATAQIQTLPNYLQLHSWNNLNCCCDKWYEVTTHKIMLIFAQFILVSWECLL